MNVGELKKLLQGVPDDLQVVVECDDGLGFDLVDFDCRCQAIVTKNGKFDFYEKRMKLRPDDRLVEVWSLVKAGQ
jgi:hypothetical protein